MTEAEQSRFLKALAECGVVASACRTARVSDATVYLLRKSNDDFRAAWEDALETATDALESEARRRALEGIREPVIYQGQPSPMWERDLDGDIMLYPRDTPDGKGGTVVMREPRQHVVGGVPQYLTIRKHSDPLLMFLLKANRKKFGDKASLELSNPDGTLAPVDETTKAARLATIFARAQARAAADSEKENYDDLG